MDCPICCEPYSSDTRKPYCLPCGHTMCGMCTAKQSLCPECRRRFSPADLRVVFDMIPESNPPTEDVKIRNAADKVLNEITSQSEKAKSRLSSARSQREQVRFQNADVKATISKSLDLAIDQLTKLRMQLLADVDSTETANSEAMGQLETELMAQMKKLAAQELRVKAKGRTEEEVDAVSTELSAAEVPREVTFVRYTANRDFGTEVLQKAAELRKGIAATQVVTLTPAKKPAFANKYVPVSVSAPPPRAQTSYHPAPRAQAASPALAKWFYEYKGSKKAFTPDFSAALERALQCRQGWCELRDKQQKLIFEVNLHTCMSFRPGASQYGCPVSREVI